MWCYQLPWFIDYDPELVWSLVQRHGGTVTCDTGGVYLYHIAEHHSSILILAWPQLRRLPHRDLYT